MKEEWSWRKRSKEEEGNGIERKDQKGLGRTLKAKTQEAQLSRVGPVWSASLTSFWKNSFWVCLSEVVVLFLVHNRKRNEGREKGREGNINIWIGLPPPMTSLPIRENVLEKCTYN